jgi:menaquinone-specific isochorismate synthase
LNSFSDAKSLLKEKLIETVGKAGKHIPEDNLRMRLEIPLENIDLKRWLNQQEQEIKIYWASREGEPEVAGIGAAEILGAENQLEIRNVFQKMSDNLRTADGDFRYFGGLRFDSAVKITDHWQPFKTALFVLPQFELVRQGSSLAFACNLVLDKKTNCDSSLKKILFELESLKYSSHVEMPSILSVRQIRKIPGEQQWKKRVEAILEAMKETGPEKVVLSGQTDVYFNGEIAAENLFLLLKRTQPGTTCFFFQPQKKFAFFGITPELLYRRAGKSIRSEAIAGTRRRGTSPPEDRLLESELKQSGKELNEHRLVAGFVENSLEEMCSRTESGQREAVLKLTHVQHLYSSFSGELKNSYSDFKIISRLHPTPAVGGFPRDLALQKIAELESHDRGWYAGPIGWIGSGSAEFAVAIRSALLHENILSLFAGAGIVKGSVPEAEWKELENKLANFLGILKIE